MTMKEIDGAPHLRSLGAASDLYGIPGLPFTPAIRVKAGADYVFVAGVLGPATADDPDPGLEAEVRRVYQNLATVLERSGARLDDIVSLTKYVNDMERDNDVIADLTVSMLPHLVATTTVEISRFVPQGARLEVSAVAAVWPDAESGDGGTR